MAVPPQQVSRDDGQDISLLDVARLLTRRWQLLLGASLLAGAAGYAVSWLIAPTYTARTLFVPPQQQQSTASSALASLGALASLAGGGSIKTSSDQYVTLLQSANVEDRIIDRFKLMELYEQKHRSATRKLLESNVRVTLGKKDGLITLEVDAESPQLAADIANQYVDELRRLNGELALTEAKQRRVFFESELHRVKARLAEAQTALQASGISAGALKVEPKTAAEGYARLKAEVTLAEVRLQTMSRTLANGAPEVQQQTAALQALRGQLRQLEAASRDTGNEADYVGNYREFKYQEALFEIFSKQYEMARLDESKENSLVQVVDVATPPEIKSKPRRSMFAAGGFAVAFLIAALWLILRNRESLMSPRPDAITAASGA